MLEGSTSFSECSAGPLLLRVCARILSPCNNSACGLVLSRCVKRCSRPENFWLRWQFLHYSAFKPRYVMLPTAWFRMNSNLTLPVLILAAAYAMIVCKCHRSFSHCMADRMTLAQKTCVSEGPRSGRWTRQKRYETCAITFSLE